MKLQTELRLIAAASQIDYQSQILIMGSCFQKHTSKFNYY